MMDRKEYKKQWRLKNLEKDKETKKQYYQKNKDAQRNRDLVSRYNITSQDYDDMLERQGHKCACCGVSTDELKTLYPDSHISILFVDHCHHSGKVRGLLCNSCNTFVGFLEKRQGVLEQALGYINEHKQNTT